MVEDSKTAVEPVRVTAHGHRFYSEEHKRAIVQKCLAPGASVAAVALAHGFNANLVRKWIDKHRRRVAAKGTRLMPVTVKREVKAPRRRYRRRRTVVAKATAVPNSVIELEVGGAKIVLRGEVDCARLRAVLETLAQVR